MSEPPANGSRYGRDVALTLVYGVMVLGAVGVFFLVRSYGETLEAPPGPGGTTSGEVSGHQLGTLFHVLLALAAIIGAGRLLGRAFTAVGQPPVIGEVIAGILLGPSLLGRVSPEAMNFLLPSSATPFLGVIAQLGVILYMFLVGLELNAERLKDKAHATVAISHASIVLPFVLGATLALWLYPMLSSSEVPFTSFALFMGVALSVTAFPVMARILTDRRMHKTGLGVVALSCAAADDVTAWCLLAFVVGVAQAKVGGALVVIALSLAYLALMLGAVRPLARRYFGRYREENQVTTGVMACVLVALLLSALATEAIGIHAIFGAFVLGAIIPHDSAVVRAFHRRTYDVVTVLLLPAFFAYTGLRTQVGLVDGAAHWVACGVIVVVATLGKLGGTLAAARLAGLGWRESGALGMLMNTRGLMALIVLDVGLNLGVISPTLFAMMVLMAVITTLATAPALHLLGYRGNKPHHHGSECPAVAESLGTGQ